MRETGWTAGRRAELDHPPRGGRCIPVATVVGMIAEGMTMKEILGDYPPLQRKDMREALRFAVAAVNQVMPLPPG